MVQDRSVLTEDLEDPLLERLLGELVLLPQCALRELVDGEALLRRQEDYEHSELQGADGREGVRGRRLEPQSADASAGSGTEVSG